MQNKNPLDLITLFKSKLGDKIDDFTLPPPIFTMMACEVIEYNEVEKSLTVKIPINTQWLNPYGTMQGGMIDTAIDNAVGPLSMLVAPPNMTRTIETKLIKSISLDVEDIYVVAHLVEQKKRRLTFEAKVIDADSVVYATSRVVNFVLAER